MLIQQMFNGQLPQLVMFDLDGTLVDSIPDLAAAIDQILLEYGKPCAGVEKASHWIGNGVPLLVQRALKDAGFSEQECALEGPHFQQALSDFSAAYDQTNGHHTTIYPGVITCLEALQKAGVTLALITNKSERFTHRLLELIHLQHYFALVVCGDSLIDEQGNAIRKPNPKALLHVIHKLKAQPENTLMVGDSRHDIEAAKAAGVTSVAVPYGYNHGEPVQLFKPDYLVSSLDQLFA